MNTNQSTAILATFLLLYTGSSSADLAFYDPNTNQGILDQVVAQFQTQASTWKIVVMNAASWLFWTLGTIGFAWTMGMLALKKADIGDFYAEFIRFTLFFGFFYWLLQNGPNFANSIIQSLRQIGNNAAGTTGLSPSSIVDVGFMIWKQAMTNLSVMSPIDSAVGAILSLGILLVLAVIAVNMLVLLVSAWFLMYAGIFFLGFGGSRWTSEMAISYYKMVLGVGVQLFAMILLVGIGNSMLSNFYAQMSNGTLNGEELGVMLVFCVALLLLVAKIPPLLSGIITGHSVGMVGGIGNYGAGSVAAAAIGAASMASSTALAGAANIAGGTQALMAAYQKAVADNSGGGGGSSMSGMPDYNSNSGSGQSSQAQVAKTMGIDTSGSGAGFSTGSMSNGNQSGGIAKAAKIVMETGTNLAQGVGQVAKDKTTTAMGAVQSRIDQTIGGQVATVIKNEMPSFGDDSLAGDTQADPVSEVDAFVNRTQSA